MRVGLLSDIHGNSWALEAVLNDAAGRKIDRWLNLGDILYGPFEPLKTYCLLQQLEIHTLFEDVSGGSPRVRDEAAIVDLLGDVLKWQWTARIENTLR